MHKRGFTLIELLVVIAIIGILASIVMVSLSGAKAKARDARRQADIKSIQLALSLYYNDNGMYPKNIYSTSGSAPSSGLAPTYLPTVPKDPNASGSCANSGNPGCYKYAAYGSAGACNPSNGTQPVSYHLGAAVEDKAGSITSNDADAPNTGGVFTGYSVCSGVTGGTAFDGNSTNCGGSSAATPDPCYDVTP
jgi:type II secretion system protein G